MNKYSEYKISGINGADKIPSHWDIKQFKYSVESIKNGTSSQQVDYMTNYKVTRIETISTGQINYEKVGNIEWFKGIEQYKLNKGDILFSNINSLEMVGNIAVYEGENDLYSGMNLLRIVPNKDVDNKWLYYIMKSKFFKRNVEAIAKHAINQVSVSNSNLKSIKVCIPPLEEQVFIAKFLDIKTTVIDNVISKKEELIETLEISRQNLILETVTEGLNKNVEKKDSGVEWIGKIPKHWTLSKVKYKVDINKNVLSEKTNDEYEIKYIDIGSVNSSGEITQTELMEFKDAPSRARRIIKSKDTLVSTVRTYLKAITWIDKAEENLVCSTGFTVLSPSEELDYRYLGLLFRSSKYINEIVKRSKGVSYPAITATEIGNMELILPPLQEQKVIADKLYTDISKIDRIILKTEEQIEMLKKAKQKLITEVVIGKIDVRGYKLD